MQIKINGEQPFQVLGTTFTIGPSSSGYDLYFSADGFSYSKLFTVGANTNRQVTQVAAGSYYKLSGNTDTAVTVNWIANCVTEGGGGGSYVLPVASSDTLGGIKVGSGLSIDSNGVLSSDGGGGDMTVLKSVAELPVSAGTGDVMATAGEIPVGVWYYGGEDPYTGTTWNGDGGMEYRIFDTGNTAGVSQVHLLKYAYSGVDYYVGLLWDTDHFEVVFSPDFNLANNVQGRETATVANHDGGEILIEDENSFNLQISTMGAEPEYEVPFGTVGIGGPMICEDMWCSENTKLPAEMYNGLPGGVFQYTGSEWKEIGAESPGGSEPLMINLTTVQTAEFTQDDLDAMQDMVDYLAEFPESGLPAARICVGGTIYPLTNVLLGDNGSGETIRTEYWFTRSFSDSESVDEDPTQAFFAEIDTFFLNVQDVSASHWTWWASDFDKQYILYPVRDLGDSHRSPEPGAVSAQYVARPGYWLTNDSGQTIFHLTDKDNTLNNEELVLGIVPTDDHDVRLALKWENDEWNFAFQYAEDGEWVDLGGDTLSNILEGSFTDTLGNINDEPFDIVCQARENDSEFLIDSYIVNENDLTETPIYSITIYMPFEDKFGLYQYHGENEGWKEFGLRSKSFYINDMFGGTNYSDLADFVFQYDNGESGVTEDYPVADTHIYVWMGQDFSGAFDPGSEMKGYVEVFPVQFFDAEGTDAVWLTGTYSKGGQSGGRVMTMRVGLTVNGGFYACGIEPATEGFPESPFFYFTSGGTAVNVDAYEFAMACGPGNIFSPFTMGVNGIIIVDENDTDTQIGYGNIVASRPLTTNDYADVEFGFKVVFEFMVGDHLYRAIGDIVYGGSSEGWNLGSVALIV